MMQVSGKRDASLESKPKNLTAGAGRKPALPAADGAEMAEETSVPAMAGDTGRSHNRLLCLLVQSDRSGFGTAFSDKSLADDECTIDG